MLSSLTFDIYNCFLSLGISYYLCCSVINIISKCPTFKIYNFWQKLWKYIESENGIFFFKLIIQFRFTDPINPFDSNTSFLCLLIASETFRGYRNSRLGWDGLIFANARSILFDTQNYVRYNEDCSRTWCNSEG